MKDVLLPEEGIGWNVTIYDEENNGLSITKANVDGEPILFTHYVDTHSTVDGFSELAAFKPDQLKLFCKNLLHLLGSED